MESFGESYEADLPDVGYGAHLLGYICKFGEINYTEILSWCELTATPLTAWEAETMFQIRSIYDSVKQKAVKHDMPAPYCSDENVIIEAVDKQFDALWSAAG